MVTQLIIAKDLLTVPARDSLGGQVRKGSQVYTALYNETQNLHTKLRKFLTAQAQKV